MADSPVEALLYAGIVPFDSIRQRPQWLAEGLAEHTPVLYLEPNASPLRGHFSRPHRAQLGPQLERLEPGTGWPFSGYHPALNRLNYRRVRRLTQAHLLDLNWKPSHLLVSFPKQLALLEGWPQAKVIYDVMDDYPAFFGKREGQVLAGLHRQLLERADLVIASSTYLAQGLEPWVSGRQVHILENAVPASFGSKGHSLSAKPPVWPKPCFGYVGALASWLDYEAIASLALAYPQGSVVLVGPEHTRLPELPSNVHLLGERPHAELPSLIRSMDLTLVPFQVSEATHAVNPVKVYEYLACGRPVLATPCRELERFEIGVQIAPAGDWPRAAAACLERGHDPVALQASVRDQTWDARVDRLRTLMESVDGLPAS